MAKKIGKIKNLLIDSTKQDKGVAERKIAEYELGEINRMIRDPSRARRLATTMRKSMSEDDVLKFAKKKKLELIKKLEPKVGRGEDKEPTSIPYLYSERSVRSPLSFMDNGAVQLDSAYATGVIAQAQQQQMDCPILIIGQQRSSDFRQYLWSSSGSNSAAYWPLSSAPQLPNQTPTQGWTSETGANFWAWARSRQTCFTDTAGIGIAGVLQFTLPAPVCDSIFYWGTRGLLRAPTPWFIDAQFGAIWANWVIRVDPTGGGWPPSFWGPFGEVPSGGIRVNQTMNLNDPKEGDTRFEGEFQVAAGVSPRIYLGISLWLSAWEGEVSTIRIGGIGDFYELTHGVTYLGTSV